jgi:hypothetical protein
MDTVELIGVWWLPENPNELITGKLSYSNKEGINLSLIGVFKDDAGHTIPFINGLTSCGKKITLYNSFCSSYRGSMPGFKTQEYISNFLFKGFHFTSYKDLKFKKLSVDFYNANKWLEFKEGFNEKRDFKRKTIILELGPNLYYETKVNDLTISLNINYNVNRNYQIYKAIAKQQSQFSIEIKNRTNFDNILELYAHLKNLLVLCTQAPIISNKITLVTKKGSSNTIEVFFSEKADKKLYLEEKELLPPNLIEGKYFQNNFNQLVYNWFTKREKIDFQVENFFNLYYFNAFDSDKFLTNTRLLESLHKAFINESEVYQAIRYKEMLLRFKRHIKSRLKITNNQKWCQKIRDYRNMLTHNNRINKSKALQLKDLERITHESKLLILASLLHEMDISSAEIGSLITRGFRFSTL